MNQLEQIKLPILADLVRFNEIFDNTLRHTNPLLHRVFQHILMRKGKLMRPTLLLLTAREYGQPTEATYLSAVMLELLHTASLVHDDVVDESDERRGQSAVHSDFGNNVAVLVGDWLLSSALEKAAETHNLRNHTAIKHRDRQPFRRNLLRCHTPENGVALYRSRHARGHFRGCRRC